MARSSLSQNASITQGRLSPTRRPSWRQLETAETAHAWINRPQKAIGTAGGDNESEEITESTQWWQH